MIKNNKQRPVDAQGTIQTWSKQWDAAAAETTTFGYDAVNQLLSAVSSVSGATAYHYRYDKGGNRTSEQIGSGVTAVAHNAGNEAVNLSATGPIRIAGTVSKPADVTINGGASVRTDATNSFESAVTLPPGVNTVTVAAKDGNGVTTTQNYQVTVGTAGAERTLSYDANGNLTDDGAGRTFGWDAGDRLVTITQGTNVTTFVYDGQGRRVQEKLNGTEIKRWIWAGNSPVEERDATNAVTKRFYGNGEQIAGVNYYFTTDHLGSVREMTDSTGAIRARYDYDPYGRKTKVSGDLEADFGFTGHYYHATSGLSLTLYRAYDPTLGRWLCRDPIGERGGVNLYGYCGNSPINQVDTLGLAYEITPAQGLHYNDRQSSFAFKIISDGSGGVTTAPMGGSHTYNEARAHRILGGDLLDPAEGKKLRNLISDAFDNPSYTSASNETYLRDVGGGLRRTIQNLALVTIAVNVATVAVRADTIAHNLVQHACETKNGDGWGAIALNQDMQDLAPGFAGHMAWLIAIGNL